MTEKHTPDFGEPWGFYVMPPGKVLKTKRVCWQVGHTGANGGVAIVFGDDESNAARIVACVNAMADIPDPSAFVARAKRIEEASDDSLAWDRKRTCERCCGLGDAGPDLQECPLCRGTGIANSEKPDIVERLRTEPDCKCAAHSRSECSCNTSWPEEHIDEAAAEIERLRAERDRLREAIEWACGSNGDFRPRGDGEGAYWWRIELRKRAALNPPA